MEQENCFFCSNRHMATSRPPSRSSDPAGYAALFSPLKRRFRQSIYVEWRGDLMIGLSQAGFRPAETKSQATSQTGAAPFGSPPPAIDFSADRFHEGFPGRPRKQTGAGGIAASVARRTFHELRQRFTNPSAAA